MLKTTNTTRILPDIGVVLGAALSLYFLSRAMQTIPMGTAYAVWTGIGSIGTVILGIAIYGDPINLERLFFLSVLIFSLVGLKFYSGRNFGI